jgi:glucosamine kinase
VCVGASGAARPEVSEFVRRVVAEVVPAEIMVVGDMVTATHAAFEGGPGVIVIAGTGSIAYGKNVAGRTLRVGGWGFAVSDEGSGQWIGRTAVSAALRARDEGRPSELLEAIQKAWKAEGFEEVVRMANGTPPPLFSDLFPVVLQLAKARDEIALQVLNRAGVELAELARIVLARLFSLGESVPLAMSGGVFRESALVREVFYNSVRVQRPKIALKPEVVEPVDGALALARTVASQ